MVLGMSLSAFTQFHVALSLIGIATGFVVLFGMWSARRMEGWTAVFLATTVATSVTGFLFPFKAIGPPHVFGVISLVLLAFAVLGYYTYRLVGRWRRIYVIGAVVSLYLNVFVGVVQAFLKIPALHALAPQGREPPFAIAQGLVFLAFVAFGYRAMKRFHPDRAVTIGFELDRQPRAGL